MRNLPSGVVAREPERGLRQVVRPEGEEVGVLGDLVGADAGPRELDHRPDEVLDVALLVGRLDRELAEPPQLLLEADERMHDLDERRVARSVADGDRGADDRPHLHLVDLREHEAQPAAAGAEHRVRLVERADPGAHALVRRLLERGQELVQRRVEQPDRHRQPRHGLEDALEVALLVRQEPVERRAPLVLARRHDHLADDGQAVVGHEHVLGAAEADALGAELARLRGVLGRVRVRPAP